MNSLYSLALRQVASLQSDLASLEQAVTAGSPAAGLHGQITASLTALQRTIDDYEGMSRSEPVEAKRDKAKSRISRFRDDHGSLRKQFDRVKQRERTAKEEGTRSELFASSSAIRSPTVTNRDSPFAVNMHRTNASMAGSMGGPSYGAMNGNPSSGYRTNAALNEHGFLASTSNTLDGYIAQGQAILGNLGDQRDILKGTQKRLRDAATTLGLSRGVIQTIESRSKGDFIVLLVGMVVVFTCMYYILKWFG